MATVFTTFSNEVSVNLPIYIDGTKVPTHTDPKVLGVVMDPLLTFKNHAKSIKEKVNKRNNVLKALTGSSWGMDKEILLTTHNAINKSVLSYCAPIWTPALSTTKWNDLQTSQNAALRTALGCTKMTDVDHLHSEARVMPVRAHNEMLSKQFLLQTCRPNHPNKKDLNHVPPRTMKETLVTKYAADVSPFTINNTIDDLNYKEAVRSIHTTSVQRTIQRQAPNKVLGVPAPNINKNEKTLPRRTRTLLSQLRSGYSTHLNSYLARINPEEHQDSCPKCGQSPHNTPHLFNCQSDPTELTTRILWEDPPAAATFLGLDLGGEVVALDDND